MPVYRVRPKVLEDSAEFGVNNRLLTEDHGWLWRSCDQVEATGAIGEPLDEPLFYFKSIADGFYGQFMFSELEEISNETI